MSLNIPLIYTEELAVFPIDKNTSLHDAFEALKEGHFILVEDYYSTGLNLINALKSEFKELSASQFSLSRTARNEFREVSHKVLLEVDNHKLLVKKAPLIPWLKKFYPNEDYFAISFPDIQALNSSWQWYKRGIRIPGITHKIHPWYGVYFPTRFEHIEAFTEWLHSYNGNQEFAYDIGCGSGVLSFLLEAKGFNNVLATDINPNAIKSLDEEILRHSYKNIYRKQGDLFADFEKKADLVVFNPPWLPEKAKNMHLDQAVFYNEDLFPNFFEQAHKRLNSKGKLVLLFSNLLKQTHGAYSHPIENEIENNRRFKLDKTLTKPVARGSVKTKRDTSRRENEQVELWILEPI